jgi:dihydroorotate dehydrogenase
VYSFLRPLLFGLDPERAHGLTLSVLRIIGSTSLLTGMLRLAHRAPEKPVNAFGLRFKNPLGLAAGYDKDGVAVTGLAALGFGHVEIGTVTPLKQDGNPKPRVFRLVEDEAVINRMGFPSRGAAYVRKQLMPKISPFHYAFRPRLPRRDFVLGVNLGKNKDTPNEEAVLDYLALVQQFSEYADYLAINVSSPNTMGLRQLQGREVLEELLAQVHAQRKIEERRLEKRLPVLVKLAPDLSEAELDDAIDVILRANMDGIIVTNTTLAREGLRSSHNGESGGLSGKPLAAKSEAVLRQTVKRVNGRIPIVSAGGVMSADDAKRRLGEGAALVQIYTGLIFHGPRLIRDILRTL